MGAASLLFFVSGWAALSYEVVWFKRASHLWGSSSLAMAAVVAAFLFGLGFGALVFGRLADRTPRPLRLYGLFELGIAVAAVLVPLELRWLSGYAATLQVSAAGHPLLLAAIRFGLTLLVLGPACMLMGGTLPLVIRRFAGPERDLGRATAWLYAINTLGGAAGAWISGFHLLPALGIVATGNLAVLANLGAGIGALALARRLEPRGLAGGSQGVATAQAAATARDEGPRLSRALLLTCAALTGYAALALQMMWARQIALVIGGSTYAFTATITVFVLGLGAGSLLFRILAPQRQELQRMLSVASVIVVVSTLGGLTLGPALAEIAGEVQRLRANAVFDGFLAVGVAFAFQGIATLGMGLLFPALVALADDGGERAGRTVGSIYAANTLGAILGAATTAIVLLPQAGSFLGFRLALGCYVVVLVLLFPPLRLPVHRASLGGALACGVVLLATWKVPDPRAMNLGRYLMGNTSTADLNPMMEVHYFEEGATSNVLVMRAPQDLPDQRGRVTTASLSLRVNGKVDATSGGDMDTQVGLAYFPRLLRPGAKKTLVIGLGSGTTAGASLLFGDSDVVCCEIEPAIIEASRLFSEVNHRPHESNRFRIVTDDGRSFVQGTEEVFDLIISEPSNPWLAGVGNLFTAEFYAAAKRRLSADGVLAQWVQAYATSPVEYALVARTVLSEFPYCVLVRVSDADTILLAAQRPLLSNDATVLDAAQQLVERTPAVARDLQTYFGTSDVRSLLLEHVILDEQGLGRFAEENGERVLNTDTNLRLEFDAPRQLFAGPLSMRRLTHAFHDVATPRVVQNAFLDWDCGADQIDALRVVKTRLFKLQEIEHAMAIVQLALAYAPDDPELMADSLLFEQFPNALEFEITAERLLDASLLEAYRAGSSLIQMGRAGEARIVLEALSERAPTSATCFASLATVYAVLGLTQESEQALLRANELDPLDDLARELKRAFDAED